MKAIHADPKDVRKLFTENYVIPEYQRPYSWENEHCQKLWDDIVIFHEKRVNRDEKYFLGNLVIHKIEKNFIVIDGQQRLTTLLMLIKALHLQAGTVVALEKCLKKEDPLTTSLINELRVETRVFEDDKKHLYDIVFNNGNGLPENNFKVNFDYLKSAIDKFREDTQYNADKLNDLILTILDNIVLLPIECGSEDDALTIFETINNRGMSLSDADIFKAKLYSVYPEKDKFIAFWNSITDHEWLFRIHMYVEKAINNDTNKEIALRTYFSNKERLQNKYIFVVECLNIYSSIIYDWHKNDYIQVCWEILKTYPNQYWNYPLFVFLRKHGAIDNDGQFTIDTEHQEQFEELITQTLKYVLIKGVVYNSVNTIKDTIFKVCALIESEGEYIKEYISAYKDDMDEFKSRLNKGNLGRYLRTTVLSGAMLNENQQISDYATVITGNYHIEHILPKKWNEYDGWNDESWENNLNTLGNLMPLEWNLNICAKNEYFPRKKDKYGQSKIAEALALMNIPAWLPENVINRNTTIVDRLIEWYNTAQI